MKTHYLPLARVAVAGAAVVGVALAACSAPAPLEVPGLNRDLHGPPDVQAYIERLQDEARVLELQPARVVESLAVAPCAVVADLGCGPGVMALPFARAVPEGIVYAVDVEPAQLDALRERLLADDVTNVVPVLASYSDPHLPPGRVDLCLVSDTYHHIDDRVEYFDRLRDDLAPGGRLVIVDYKDGDLPVGPPPSRKVASVVRHAELAQAGWRLAQRFAFHAWHEFEVWQVAGADPE